MMDVFAAPARNTDPRRLNVSSARHKKKLSAQIDGMKSLPSLCRYCPEYQIEDCPAARLSGVDHHPR
jgi:hypothetical protein